MALAWVGCQLINFLWQVARLHYLKQMPVNGIPFFGKPKYEEVMKSTGSGEPIEIGEMSFHLLYYEGHRRKQARPEGRDSLRGPLSEQ